MSTHQEYLEAAKRRGHVLRTRWYGDRDHQWCDSHNRLYNTCLKREAEQETMRYDCPLCGQGQGKRCYDYLAQRFVAIHAARLEAQAKKRNEERNANTPGEGPGRCMCDGGHPNHAGKEGERCTRAAGGATMCDPCYSEAS